jgi:hypothetical protein
MNHHLRAYTVGAVVALGLAISPAFCSTCDDAFVTVLKLRSWKGLHAAWRRYPGCDDGAIGQGYSDFIVRTLATRWPTLRKVLRIAREDPKFLQFVIAHIDATTDPDDLTKVQENANQRCPEEAATVCSSILARTAEALADSQRTTL